MKKKKQSELRKKLKNATFLECVFWIFVISCVSFGGYSIFYSKFIQPNLYNVEFRDIDGIIKGSPVRFMGIVVGHVRNLTYKKNGIEVQFIITKKDLKIPDGSIASIEFTGLAGSKSLELRPPKDNLSDIGIVVKDTLRIADLMNSAEGMVKAFSDLKNFVDGINQKTILKIFGGISKTTTTAKNLDKMLDDRNKNSKNIDLKIENLIKEQKKIGETLDNLNTNTKKLNQYLKK